MNNFANLNGDGEFVLRINGEVAQRIRFTAEDKEMIQFNFKEIFSKPEFASLLVGG